MQTLIILNPHAASGRAGKLWSQIEPLLWKELGELVVAVTEHPEEVAQHLDKARAAGLTRVIAIGGDGTNHVLVNELVRLNQQNPGGTTMTFGILPIGTGHDWARTLGIPLNIADAVRWLKAAQPTPLDLGHLAADAQKRNFLNIASVGIGGMIAGRVNRLKTRRPWSFYKATLESLLAYRPQHMTIRLDGKPWFDDRAYVVAVANGQAFGRGMRIAPDALYNDGQFDIVLVENVSRMRAISILNSVYSAGHLKFPEVHSARARVVEIESQDGAVGMEMDGEPSAAKTLRFEVLPSALNILAAPVGN
jgi:diacylglycerol kinase (ATP)